MCLYPKVEKFFRLIAGCALLALILSTSVSAGDQSPIDSTVSADSAESIVLVELVGSAESVALAEDVGSGEETMLMFVGESEPVVTVASRRPESPTTAPAIVTVVGREEIELHGYRTLAELLNDQIGFYMSAGGRGTVPYLRGLRDSILFLYDGVPLATEVTKNFAVLDREISLDAIERIEIVRGAGSVLWGADAFSGVVNIVPKSGQQHAGVEVGLEAGNNDVYGGTLSWGKSQQNWDAFLSASGSSETLDSSGSSNDPDASHYGELVGSLNVGEWLHLSGRWSDFKRHYTMHDGTDDISWEGTREAPVSYIKATASKVYGPSHYSLTGFYQYTDFQMSDADSDRSQRNHVMQAELLWDRRIMSRGLLTAGASWRRNDVDDAFVRDGFFPPGDFWVPQIDQSDFTNDLASVFGQFRYQWGKGEWWAGLRLDDHSEYESTVSYSLGFHQPIGEGLNVKVVYGTAFRSPYSSQLFNNQAFDPESVETVSAQLTWDAGSGRSLELTLFHSDIDDHLTEDPYGGLSSPSSREIYGVEFIGKLPLTSALTLNGGFTALESNGNEEHFRVVDYIFVRPDGTQVPVYAEWDEPVEEGPSWIANLGLNWAIAKRHNLNFSGRVGGSYDYSYEKGTVEGSYDYPWVFDASYNHPGFFSGKDNFTLRATNLFDRDYTQPDVFGPIDGPPLQMTLEWKYRF